MSAKLNPPPSSSESTLRDRAIAARANLAKPPTRAALEAQFGDARAYADAFDFSLFSLIDVARLYEVSRQLAEHAGHTTNMPLCSRMDHAGLPMRSPLGWFLEFEAERLSFLRDRCVAELVRRQPQNDSERDEILNARIAHEIDCNGRISEAGLLLEALKAWG